MVGGDDLSLEYNPISCEAIEVHIPILESRRFNELDYPDAPNLNVACYPIPIRHADNVGYGSELSWEGLESGIMYEVFLCPSNENLISIGEGQYMGNNTFTIFPNRIQALDTIL